MSETDLSEINNLSELEQIVDSCTDCALGKTRTKAVFGVGNPNSSLIFVGEAPGFHEDQQGRPFVGAAGRLLDELLISILGVGRKDIFIANVLKCRPPGNRDPLPGEIEQCRSFLDKQIELIDPRVICTLGNHATRVVLNKNINISKIHGRPIEYGDRWIFPAYHPAAGLYAGAVKELLSDDFKKLGDLLVASPGLDTKTDPPAEQMDLF